MATVTLAFLGDIVGAPGRRVVTQQLPRLRERFAPDLVIANAENARSGSGLTPDLYRSLRALGIDAITLGDHCYRDRRIVEVLSQPDQPILRPANLSSAAIGRRWIRLALPADVGTNAPKSDDVDRGAASGGTSEQSRGSTPQPPNTTRTAPGASSVYVITVLGRIYMPLPADDPFAAVDRLLAELPERDPIVFVEAHMETTSEKIALARHLDGRVAAVVGTHTHVPTADARILAGGTAFISDVGMCGPYDSIIGRDATEVLRAMTTGMHTPFPVAEGGESMCGCVVTIDRANRRAVSIERFGFDADRRSTPFA